MRCRWLALGFCLSLAVSGCVSPSGLQTYQPKDPEEAKVVASLMRIPNGMKAKSLELLMQAYSPDVYVGNFHRYLGPAAPGAPVSINGTELRVVYAEIFRGFKEVSMDVKDVHMTIGGDRAVVEAKTELLLKNEAGRGESKQGDIFRNEVVWRMQRTPLGWKIVEEIWQ